RPSAGIQAIDPAGPGLVDDGEEVAADAVVVRLHESHDGVRGNRGVHGVAPALQDLYAGTRRQRMARRHDAEPGGHLRAAGDRPATFVLSLHVRTSDDGDERHDTK